MKTLIQQLDQSIDDACKISRRHCYSLGINKKAHQAAMRLVYELQTIRTKEIEKSRK